MSIREFIGGCGMAMVLDSGLFMGFCDAQGRVGMENIGLASRVSWGVDKIWEGYEDVIRGVRAQDRFRGVSISEILDEMWGMVMEWEKEYAEAWGDYVSSS